MIVALVIAVVAAALWVFRRPPLSAALAAALWVAAMSAAPHLLGSAPDAARRSILSALFGVLVLATAFAVDGRTRRDHAGWLYVAGLALLSGGVVSYRPVTATSLAATAAVQAWLFPLALHLRRRSFAIFGALGLASVAGRVAGRLLEDAVVPFTYAAIALLLAAGALLWERRAESWSDALAAHLPPPLRRILPPDRRRP